MFKIALKCYFGVGCVLFYNFGREVLCFSTDQQSALYSCVSDVIWGYKLKFYYVVQFLHNVDTMILRVFKEEL